MTIVSACASGTAIDRVGTPTRESGSMPLFRSRSVVLSAISRTWTPRPLADRRLNDAGTGRQAVHADGDIVLGQER